MNNQKTKRIGSVASTLCILHCIGLPLLQPALSFLNIAHEGVEIFCWGLCLLAICLHIYKNDGLVRLYFVPVAIIGSVGILVHNHLFVHVACIGMLIGFLLFKKDTACCVESGKEVSS